MTKWKTLIGYLQRTAPRCVVHVRGDKYLAALKFTGRLLLLFVLSRAWGGSFTNTGGMNYPRALHSATLLLDGKVLVGGGEYGRRTTELYDPLTGTWSLTGNLVETNDSVYFFRIGHTAVRLADGRVLMLGGGVVYFDGGSGVESYDPINGTWTAAAPMAVAQVYPPAALLPDGRVVVGNGNGVELYDPITGSWGSGPTNLPCSGPAFLLPNGKVLFAGSAVLYDPNSDALTQTGAMNFPRANFTMTQLFDGKVL